MDNEVFTGRPEPIVTRRGIIWAKVAGYGIMTATLVLTIILAVAIFSSPPPARFSEATLLTPEVQPVGGAVASREGTVRMRLTLDSELDPACYVTTQFVIEFADNVRAYPAGMRLNTQGDVKVAIYEAPVPLGMAPGTARYWIRDVYNCGVRARVAESPHVEFVVLP